MLAGETASPKGRRIISPQGSRIVRWRGVYRSILLDRRQRQLYQGLQLRGGEVHLDTEACSLHIVNDD